jgi:adenosylcobinamide-GDP ribazoletransferase
MRSLGLAIQFLTLFPIRFKRAPTPEEQARSMIFFPVVGLGLGLFIGLIYYLLTELLLPLSAAAVLVLLYTLMTGGLHLDALADLSDGLYAGRDRDEIIQIMKDPHIGVMGAIAIFLVLLAKFSLISGIPSHPFDIRPLILFPLISRWSALIVTYRADLTAQGSLAEPYLRLSLQDLILASIFAIVTTLLISGWGVVALIPCAGVALLLRGYTIKRLNGIRGDLIGATIECTEVLALASWFVIR